MNQDQRRTGRDSDRPGPLSCYDHEEAIIDKLKKKTPLLPINGNNPTKPRYRTFSSKSRELHLTSKYLIATYMDRPKGGNRPPPDDSDITALLNFN